MHQDSVTKLWAPRAVSLCCGSFDYQTSDSAPRNWGKLSQESQLCQGGVLDVPSLDQRPFLLPLLMAALHVNDL